MHPCRLNNEHVSPNIIVHAFICDMIHSFFRSSSLISRCSMSYSRQSKPRHGEDTTQAASSSLLNIAIRVVPHITVLMAFDIVDMSCCLRQILVLVSRH